MLSFINVLTANIEGVIHDAGMSLDNSLSIGSFEHDTKISTDAIESWRKRRIFFIFGIL
jgi:hypothetical protein